MILDGRSLQEYPVNVCASPGCILGHTSFPLYINDLPNNFIRNIAICASDTAFYSKRDLASALW